MREINECLRNEGKTKEWVKAEGREANGGKDAA